MAEIARATAVAHQFMSLTRASRAGLVSFRNAHHFHSSSAVLERKRGAGSSVEKRVGGLMISEDVISGELGDNGVSSIGHLLLRQKRQHLYYLRLIEHEMPKLVGKFCDLAFQVHFMTRRLPAYRKPFVPPSPSNPLIIRTISYGGEQHPAEIKRTVVIPIARLPLKNAAAVHKFKLLAGPRWSIVHPRDSGVGANEDVAEHGYFKMTCEDFPKAAMNLKWISDTVDRLLAEANVRFIPPAGVMMN